MSSTSVEGKPPAGHGFSLTMWARARRSNSESTAWGLAHGGNPLRLALRTQAAPRCLNTRPGQWMRRHAHGGPAVPIPGQGTHRITHVKYQRDGARPNCRAKYAKRHQNKGIVFAMSQSPMINGKACPGALGFKNTTHGASGKIAKHPRHTMLPVG